MKYNPNNPVVTVIDFSGMTKEVILANGYHKKMDITFVVATTHVDGSDDVVYKQSLQAGKKVAGSAITLTISPVAPSNYI